MHPMNEVECLQFRTPIAGDHSRSDDTPAASAVEKEDNLLGVLIEYCCSEQSVLCAEEYIHGEGGDFKLIRLTERHDLASKEGLEYALQQGQRYGYLPMWIWSSIPCTGGSTMQAINKDQPNHPARMAKHNRLFKKLHRNLMVLCEHVVTRTVRGKVVFEWPAFTYF